MNGRTNVTGGGSNGSLGGVIPLEAPSNFTVTPDNGKCLLTWTDPKDKYADEIGEITDEGDQLVSQFAYTRIVRKVGSAPSSPNDGDLVTDSSTRNQYQSSAYVDDGLTNNTLYYYAAFTCNTDGVYSGAAVGSGTPKSYDPILANNTWEQINDVANEGIAASVWEVGDEGPKFQITTEGDMYGDGTFELTPVITGFDTMSLTDSSGTAAITFSTKEAIKSSRFGSGIGNSCHDWDQTGTGELILDGTLLSWLSSDVTKYMLDVKCTHEHDDVPYKANYDVWSSKSYNSKIFPFTIKEVGIDLLSSNFEYPGYGYDQFPYFSTAANRTKLEMRSQSALPWQLASVCTRIPNGGSTTEFFGVNYNGTSISDSDPSALVFGFCIGKTPA